MWDFNTGCLRDLRSPCGVVFLACASEATVDEEVKMTGLRQSQGHTKLGHPFGAERYRTSHKTEKKLRDKLVRDSKVWADQRRAQIPNTVPLESFPVLVTAEGLRRGRYFAARTLDSPGAIMQQNQFSVYPELTFSDTELAWEYNKFRSKPTQLYQPLSFVSIQRLRFLRG